jgi:prepilin-type N-terminal cleavage/methylation domain-containing protein
MLNRSARDWASGGRHSSTRRAGFTLLEVLLASVVAVLLLAGLYAAIDAQLRHVQASREKIEQSTLARALLARINNDIAVTVGLSDPARFRRPIPGSTSSPSGSTSAPTDITGATSSSSSSSSATNAQPAIALPLGVIGDSTTLSLFVSKVPGEVWGSNTGDPGLVVSDLRRITYYLGNGGSGGLVRSEIKVVTSQDADPSNTLPANVDEQQSTLAPEVRTLQFSYFDGSAWQDTWDSTTMGADGATPVGSPRAIAITIGIARQHVNGKGEDVKTYRHVVPLVTANGTTPQPNAQTNPNQNNGTNGSGS